MCDSPRTGCARTTTPTLMWREQTIIELIPIEWSWWVTSNNACEPDEQLIALANGNDESDCGVESLPILTCERLNITTSVRKEWSWRVISIVACCQCEALRTCRSGFPIATPPRLMPSQSIRTGDSYGFKNLLLNIRLPPSFYWKIIKAIHSPIKKSTEGGS